MNVFFTCPTSAVHQVIKTSWSSLSLGISAAPPAPPPPATPPLCCCCSSDKLPTASWNSRTNIPVFSPALCGVNSTQAHAEGDNHVFWLVESVSEREKRAVPTSCPGSLFLFSFLGENQGSQSSTSNFTLQPPRNQEKRWQSEVRRAFSKTFIPLFSFLMGRSKVKEGLERKKKKKNTRPPHCWDPWGSTHWLTGSPLCFRTSSGWTNPSPFCLGCLKPVLTCFFYLFFFFYLVGYLVAAKQALMQ